MSAVIQDDTSHFPEVRHSGVVQQRVLRRNRPIARPQVSVIVPRLTSDALTGHEFEGQVEQAGPDQNSRSHAPNSPAKTLYSTMYPIPATKAYRLIRWRVVIRTSSSYRYVYASYY